nr:hypothetical protein [Brucella intermedia]
MADLLPCPFCSKTMMLRSALWPSEGDADAIIHAFPTDCPMVGFSDGSADGSIIEKWNCSLSNEDDFPSDGSCVRCGSVPRNANGLCNTCLDEDAEHLENTRPTPVAPVSPDATGKCGELVTVLWGNARSLSQPHDPVVWERVCASYPRPYYTVELVTRSQAEELLAAERADKRIWMEKAAIEAERVERLETDNAALTARVKELDRCHEGTIDLCLRKTAQIEVLEAKLAAAEKSKDAMRKAAVDYCWQRYKGRDPMNLKDPAVFTSHEWEKIGEVMDEAARAALGGKPL